MNKKLPTILVLSLVGLSIIVILCVTGSIGTHPAGDPGHWSSRQKETYKNRYKPTVHNKIFNNFYSAWSECITEQLSLMYPYSATEDNTNQEKILRSCVGTTEKWNSTFVEGLKQVFMRKQRSPQLSSESVDRMLHNLQRLIDPYGYTLLLQKSTKNMEAKMKLVAITVFSVKKCGFPEDD